jgi:hypothetical protein
VWTGDDETDPPRFYGGSDEIYALDNFHAVKNWKIFVYTVLRWSFNKLWVLVEG